MDERTVIYTDEATGENLSIKTPALSRAEADRRIGRAILLFQEIGFSFNYHDNLYNAFQPDINRNLALVGDSAQRLILIDQWCRDGSQTRGMFDAAKGNVRHKH